MLPVEQEACFSTHVSNYPDVACFHLDCFAIKSPFQTCATCDLWLTHTLNSKMEPDNGSRLHNIPTYVPISWLYVIKNICNYIPHPYHAICFTFVLAKKMHSIPLFPSLGWWRNQTWQHGKSPIRIFPAIINLHLPCGKPLHNYGKSPCENSLFRLGHFLCRKLLVIARG